MKVISQAPILFIDLDDTLVNSSLAYNLGMLEIGIDPSDQEYLVARAETKSILPAFAPQSQSRLLYFKRYLQIQDRYTPAVHLKMADDYEKAVCASVGTQWKKLNRRKLFTELRKVYSCIHILTNETTRFQVLKLNAIDPDFEFFDAITTSEEVGFKKPYLAMFQYELNRVGALPSKITMVGDSYENDIQPAIDLGCNAVLTCEFAASKTSGNHFRTIRRLEQLLD